MLINTKNLINAIKSESGNYIIDEINVSYIINHGTLEDAQELLDFFLKNPENILRDILLDPIMHLGDKELAGHLFEQSISNGSLKEGYPEKILHCLGYLEYDPAKPVLVKYIKSQEYWKNKNACLGLLHFPCEEYAKEIESEINNCMGKGLFNEFIPSLAGKINGNDLILKFVEKGYHTISTDCNAGVILGIALCGLKELFEKILWDDSWDILCPSTGTGSWSFISLKILGISLSELFDQIIQYAKKTPDPKNLFYMLSVYRDLLDRKIFTRNMPFNFIKPSSESYLDIYNTLFGWSEEWENKIITGLIDNYLENDFKEDLHKQFQAVEPLLLLKIEQEIIEK